MSILRCGLLLLTCLLALGAAETALTPGAYTEHTWTSPAGGDLKYCLYPPPDYRAGETLPLLVYLHGTGPREGWKPEAMQLERYPIAQHRFLLLEPFCPSSQKCWDNTGWKRGSHALSPEPTPAIRMIDEVIEHLIATRGADGDRIYLHGNSNGGYATWDLLLRWPDRFAAAIAVCGAGDPAQAAKLVGKPIWVFHCEDDKVVPFSGSKEMVDAITAAGGSPRFTSSPKGGHAAWNLMRKDPEVFPWLMAQRHAKR